MPQPDILGDKPAGVFDDRGGGRLSWFR
jgi:hypothetical protein